MDPFAPLDLADYVGPAPDAAPRLLGRFVRRGAVVLRIVEVEAYAGPEDSASHARFGRTGRTAPMWGPPGRAYVYLCYGIHWMLNIVTGAEHEGGAVLVRGAEVVSGADEVERRRGRPVAPGVLAGPGRVGAALGLDRDMSGSSLHGSGPLALLRGRSPDRIRRDARIGIDYAGVRDRRRRWRFYDPTSSQVSRRPPRAGN